MKNMPRSVLFASLILLALGGAACRNGEGDAAGPAAGGDGAPEAIVLSPASLAAGGVRTGTAVLSVFRRRVAAPGELGFNPRRLAHLTSRVQGRIERVLAVAGDRVGAGQLLAEVYSPDFLSLQAEYLQAAERAKRRSGGEAAEAQSARVLLESARSRLLLVGATAAEVEALAKAGVPSPLLRVRASFAGTIVEAQALAGDHVELGTNLFRLADLTVLWADIHVLERDLGSLQAGAVAELRVQAYPGETFPGRLLLVGDVLDEGTRALPARVEVANPAGRLKAGMYVDALLEATGARTALAVPEAAVQDDEGRDVVFVRAGAGRFVRREVRIGERWGDLVEVLEGLAEGETVATAGSFLLKSEMRKGALED